jgi:hypothetical protein
MLVAGFALAMAVPAIAQEGPAISDSAYCASAYGALARARERRSKSPKRLAVTPGFLSIDFAARQKAVEAKHPKDVFAITWHRQVLEENFDDGGYAEADGKPVPAAIDAVATLAITTARRCDQINGFQPALLDRVAAMPAPPAEPYMCAVNYMALGLGMKDPAAQQQVMQRTQAMMGKWDTGMANDSVWRDTVRNQLRADAQERSKAVGAGKIAPPQLFALAKSCDALLAAS